MDTNLQSATFLRDITKSLPFFIKEESSDKIYPLSLAANMVRTWPRNIDHKDLKFLDMICRKLSINKNIFEYYESDWKTTTNPTPLSSLSWPVVIAALLAYPINNKGNNRDRAIKYINSSFVALELMGRHSNVPHFKELKNWAESKLKLLIEK